MVSAFFLQPATVGPAELRTDIAHTGQRSPTGGVRLLQAGSEVVRAVAMFTDLGQATGRTSVLNNKPDLPLPEEAVDPLGG